MTAADWIAERRALIDAATGPEWEVFEYDSFSLGYKTAAVRTIKRSDGKNMPVCSTGCSAWPESLPDAALIADSRTSLPAALNALEAVLELHEPVDLYELDPVSGTWVYDDESDERILYGRLCRECSLDDDADEYAEGDYVSWPCSTVTAITAALRGDR